AEKQQKSVAPQIELTEISDEELARQQMYIFREYGFSEHISLMPGEDNQWTIEKYSNADLTGRFNVRVESGSAMPKSNAQMRSTIEGLHKMGFLDVSNPSTLRHILITFGMRDLMPQIDVDLRDAQRENDRFMALTRGEPTGRPPGHRPGIDNDQVHLAEHIRLAKTDAFIELERAAEQGDQGAQLFVFLWYDHIKQTLNPSKWPWRRRPPRSLTRRALTAHRVAPEGPRKRFSPAKAMSRNSKPEKYSSPRSG
ncbi:hypothetical protein LCGC14_1689920, partial [marine sediment metagenome]